MREAWGMWNLVTSAVPGNADLHALRSEHGAKLVVEDRLLNLQIETLTTIPRATYCKQPSRICNDFFFTVP